MPYDDWSTPPDWIERVRRAMGSIDLDPASNSASQEIVKATDRYGLDNGRNGLHEMWYGNVFCNPPYSAGNIDRFVDKAIFSWMNIGTGTIPVSQMIILVNSATDTAWYHKLLKHCSCVLLVKGRIKFWKVFNGPDGYKAYPTWEGELSIQRRAKDPSIKAKVGNSPRYVNTLFYFTRNGADLVRFYDTFKNTGTILNPNVLQILGHENTNSG